MKQNSDNEMASRMRKAVAEIDGDIMQLQGELADLCQLRDGLVKFYGGDTEIAPVATAVAVRKAVKAANAPSPRPSPPEGARETSAPSKRVEGSGRQMGGDSLKLLAAARTAPEPFTVPAMVVATGLDKEKVAKTLSNWKMRGLLSSEVRGEYKRTESFPLPGMAE